MAHAMYRTCAILALIWASSLHGAEDEALTKALTEAANAMLQRNLDQGKYVYEGKRAAQWWAELTGDEKADEHAMKALSSLGAHTVPESIEQKQKREAGRPQKPLPPPPGEF